MTMQQPWYQALTLAFPLGLVVMGQGAIALPLPQPLYLSQATAPDVILGPGPTSPSNPVPPPPAPGGPISSEVRFACQTSGGRPTVFYYPGGQGNQGYPWAVPSQLGGGWSELRRCQEISRRLEAYRPDGLTELRTGLENGYNTICVTTEAVPSCRIVLTVPPGQDPLVTRDRVFDNLVVAEEGRSTLPVSAYQGGGSLGGLGGLNTNRRSTPAGINLRPFLAPSDGGTGARLPQTPTTPATKPTTPATVSPGVQPKPPATTPTTDQPANPNGDSRLLNPGWLRDLLR